MIVVMGVLLLYTMAPIFISDPHSVSLERAQRAWHRGVNTRVWAACCSDDIKVHHPMAAYVFPQHMGLQYKWRLIMPCHKDVSKVEANLYCHLGAPVAMSSRGVLLLAL